ncbi:hypothetical protein ZEAMMB73_Zm00001d040990 [Zea mays]|uniref:Uncharacterized protein n=1 Tax=Zea mays TaxID=4577 RepID=A0A1D6MTP8_MAIZE|nr:hypothetical protein ZEAMMB73_Zm00001d040990 [Zea mays]
MHVYVHFLLQVHKAWLPPWLVAQYAHYVASEKLAHAKKWVETHIEATKMVMPICSCSSFSFVLYWTDSWLTLLPPMIEEWISVKEKLVALKNAEPYVQKVSTRC